MTDNQAQHTELLTPEFGGNVSITENSYKADRGCQSTALEMGLISSSLGKYAMFQH
jgi:hypothetical protein